VVLAEPDPALRGLIARRLEQEGFAVRPLESAQGVLTALDEFGANIAVVACNPGGDFFAPLRGVTDIPVVAMLPTGTAMAEALDTLDAGADNFVLKPFSPRELLSRVQALVRRLPAEPPNRAPCLQFDGLVIDASTREVTVDGELVALPAREFDLLAFLARSPRQVFTREQLMRHIWGVDVAVTTATITEHIRRLRNRIERDPRHPEWIETVWSVGYRFNPIRRTTPE